MRRPSWLFSAAQLVLVLSLVAGCRSTPKVDWPARVGTYTFDQAVVELGPPDKSTKLTDGTLVAEWAVGRSGGGLSVGVGTGYSTGRGGVGVGQTIFRGRSQPWLRLTFGPDGRLTSHSTFRR
jgi:hypothetical protein